MEKRKDQVFYRVDELYTAKAIFIMHQNSQGMDTRQDQQFDGGYLDPPYFERLETNEYIELQESRRIIEVIYPPSISILYFILS